LGFRNLDVGDYLVIGVWLLVIQALRFLSFGDRLLIFLGKLLFDIL
jgi:hypothetical protein